MESSWVRFTWDHTEQLLLSRRALNSVLGHSIAPRFVLWLYIVLFHYFNRLSSSTLVLYSFPRNPIANLGNVTIQGKRQGDVQRALRNNFCIG